MESKNLLRSKKAQSSWLGSLIISVVGIGCWKLGVPEAYMIPIITGIGGLFGAAIVSQGVQDYAQVKSNDKDIVTNKKVK